MREACIRAVTNALGNEPTQAQLRNIELRIQSAMLRGAREDPSAWRAMTPEERMAEAGRRAAEDLAVEAQKTLQRAQATIVASDRIENYRASQVKDGSDANGVEALERTLVHKYDEKNGGFRSVESQSQATFDFAMSQVADIFEDVNPGLWQRIQRDIWRMEPMRRAFTEALHGLREGIPKEIVSAAERYHEIANALREQFNAAGGVVGKLEDWGAPHTWSARLAQKLGRERFVEDMVAWADRKRYVKADGNHYTEAELREFFSEAWATIVSDGWTKDSGPGPFPGGAVKANRGSHHRVIHLRPETTYEALAKYSEQNILEAMVGGLRRMSRDVSLVETFGPNADHVFTNQLDQAIREAARIDPAKAAFLQFRAWYVKNLFDNLAGNTPPPVRRGVAEGFQTVRNINIASKLGKAVITSISDFATLYQTALLNKLNPVQVMLNSMLAWSPKSRRFSRRMGLMIDTIIADMERYSGENLTSKDWSSRTASAVIRLSGLPFVTNARRLGFAMTMMDAIGHLTRQRRYGDVNSLKAGDRAILAAKKISQRTWDIWRAAKLDRWGANHTLLTPDGIMAVEGLPMEAKRQAVIDLLSIVREEQDLAVIMPGVRERTQMLQAFRRGTVVGELGVSAMQFKQFPWAFMLRHLERASLYGKAGRYSYMAALLISMTMLGVVANWIKDLVAGKNPRNMNVFTDNPKARSIAIRNWGHAALSGGGLGLYGEYLFSETSPYSGNTLAESLLGPTVSAGGSALSLTFGNAAQFAAGDETNVGSEAVRFARGMTPGANLWQTQALTDRMVYDQLMELTDPGSTDRLRRRQERVQGSSYWWAPGQMTPESAPDLEAGVREN